MFKNATFKLTVSYLCVVMVISLVFSAVVYRVGSDNLAFGLSRQSQQLQSEFPIFSGTPYAAPNPTALSNGRSHLLNELILINLFVLVGSGFVCYILARETLKPIEDAHNQQKRFTADVSHELRTPLTAIKMESEVALMDDSVKSSQLKKVIASNIEEAAKLDGLINNLLRLTRLEAGELQKQFDSIELKTIAQEAIDIVVPRATLKKIDLKLSGAGGGVANLSTSGDKDSLVQMLVIFLDNAIKYSPKSSSVKVKLTKDKQVPIIEIEDQGSGIAAHDLEHIFERFYRADPSRIDHSGYGLGLSIAKLIADVHSADITISSLIDHGTTVKVTFPSS